ncbi:hypothetical protein SeMB42_g05853 [Synchytrium endobioticum]|uniref:Uncharacterized protein n=1 Tax=Synchytrium endobioticum TaxID=286115 RepID=A0A507CYN0_9FUNG|nr:hypothetical protein SeMB42_g05853 [Synchytrium endobioticum]TPX44171.1 hypothetical protein SeLEV6574_g04665 [Synchytrium endobioticum]
MARLPPLLVLPGVACTPLAAISALDPSTRSFGCIFPSAASLVLSFFVNFFFSDFLLQQRIDIGVVTRMVKFITISLLAYAAAFLFFTPVRAPDPVPKKQCIRQLIHAAENPSLGKEPLSFIRESIRIIIDHELSNTICNEEDVFKHPTQIPEEFVPSVRDFHECVFHYLKRLYEHVADFISDKEYRKARKILLEARALVWFHIYRHYHQERAYRSMTPESRLPREKLELPHYKWANVEMNVDENAFLESVRSAVSEATYVNDLVPDTSNAAGGGPAPELSPFSETPGALPAPSSAWLSYSGTLDDPYDSGSTSLHGRASMYDSTSFGADQSDYEVYLRDSQKPE